jgi:hypothetical protein
VTQHKLCVGRAQHALSVVQDDRMFHSSRRIASARGAATGSRGASFMERAFRRGLGGRNSEAPGRARAG